MNIKHHKKFDIITAEQLRNSTPKQIKKWIH